MSRYSYKVARGSSENSSAQSDQRLRCLPENALDPLRLIDIAKTLSSLPGCAG